MKGAIIGDIVGSVYEWNNIKTKEFPFWSADGFFTDDSVCTVAVAHALTEAQKRGKREDDKFLYDEFQRLLRAYTIHYPGRGYGGHFDWWAWHSEMGPYNSCGNGSAMRVSAVGFFAQDLAECERLAELSAAPTHNHPDGIAGAKATAGAIFLARQGASREELRQYIARFYPDILGMTIDGIRDGYGWEALCNGTVQPALCAALEAEDFEDAIRLAISVGGDSDTIGAICGGLAEAMFGVPDKLWQDAEDYYFRGHGELIAIINEFYGLL